MAINSSTFMCFPLLWRVQRPPSLSDGFGKRLPNLFLMRLFESLSSLKGLEETCHCKVLNCSSTIPVPEYCFRSGHKGSADFDSVWTLGYTDVGGNAFEERLEEQLVLSSKGDLRDWPYLPVLFEDVWSLGSISVSDWLLSLVGVSRTFLLSPLLSLKIIFWQAVRTDFFKLITNPRCWERKIKVSLAISNSEIDCAINRMSSRYMMSLMFNLLNRAIGIFNIFVKIRGA